MGESVANPHQSRRQGSGTTKQPLYSTSNQNGQDDSVINASGWAHEPDLGGIVFNGLARRLERLAREQLYAAPLGLQPYPFEPPRLTDDNYDWKNRVEAVGDGVVIPVVRAFAAGIREAIYAQDALRRERAGSTRKD
jgi:hypothetical protein